MLSASCVAVVLAVVGCAPSSTNDHVVLKWWMTVPSSDDAAAALEEVVAQYNEQQSDVEVDLQYRAVDPLKNALRLTAGSTASPDIYYMWAGPGLGGEFVDAGVSLDLTGYYEQYDWNDRFSEGTLTNYTQYGGHHGVPWTQRGEVIYYNRALFAEAGITSLPTNYAGLVAAAQQLKAAGITPMTLGGKDNWHIMRLLDAIIETECGADLGDQLSALEVSWADQPCVDEAFTQLKEWGGYFEQGYPGLAQSDAAALFQRNEAAMTFEGDWFTGSLTNPDDYGVFVFPTGTDRLYGFSEGQYITATSQHPDEAAAFLDYLTSAPVQDQIGAYFAATSVNQSVTFSEDSSNSVQEAMQQIIANAQGYYLNNDQNFPVGVTTEYWRIQNGVLAGTIQPDSAGAALQSFIDSNQR
ncbi:MAG: ABC transporter substrate-binding protein [Actinomycetales bacterium]